MSTQSVSTLVDMLRASADSHRDTIAFTFLKDGETAEAAWSYAELDRQARRVGTALQQTGEPGDRVLLLYPPGLHFIAAFFGCLYAGRVAVPTSPPSPSRLGQGLPRLQSIIASAGARVLLTDSMLAPIAAAIAASNATLAAMEIVASDALPADEGSWREPAIGAETLAFLQYTSGSTGLPKGVMVGHGNLLHNIRTIAETCTASTRTTVVSWLPVYHDMGLIGCVLHPVLLAGTTYLMSPAAFLQRPIRWLEAISRYRGEITAAPNFAYDLCVRRTTPEQRATLDLRSWRRSFNGAEPVRARTVAEFTRAFEPCGLRPSVMTPCYGLAESTLLVSAPPLGTPPTLVPFDADDLAKGRAMPVDPAKASARSLVACGSPVGSANIVIVDPENRTALADGAIGEIWIASESVAHGYWDLPDESHRAFGARLAGSEAGPFLRTGDLGFLHDGALYVAGRIKDLIIVDGRNVYPQDLELTVEQSHPAFRPGCSAAFSIDDDGAERVVVIAEADIQRSRAGEDPSTDPRATLLRAARRALAAEHDLALHELLVVRKGTIPKTTSGKISRHACRAGYLARSLEPWAPSHIAAHASE